MFDFLTETVQQLFTPSAPAAPVCEEPEPTGSLLLGDGGGGPVSDEVAASLGVDVEALRGDYTDYGGTGGYEDDLLGQYGREEDEAMQEELAMTRDLTMIDDDNRAGIAARIAESDDALTGFRSLPEMVDLALAEANGDPIGTLDLIDHGSEGSQQVGDDRLTLEAMQDPETLDALLRLRDGFGPYGALELQGCQVGAGEEGDALLRELASTLDVPVTGAYQYQLGLIPGYEGATKTCYPPVADEHGEVSQSCYIDEDPIGDAMWNAYLRTYGRDVNEVE